MAPYLDPLLKKVKDQLNLENEVPRRATSDSTLRVVGITFWAAIHSDVWKHRDAAAAAYIKFLQDPKGPVYGKYKESTFDLFKATAEVAEICLQDKLIQIFNLGLTIIEQTFTPDICGGDIDRKVIVNAGGKFLPILIDKYCDFTLKVKDRTKTAIKAILGHPFIGIGHAVDYIMNICIPPNSVEKTQGKVL